MRERPAYLRTSTLWAALTALSIALAAIPAAPTPAIGGESLRDTYYAVAPFLFVAPFCAYFALMAGFYFWCERSWGQRYDDRLGQAHLWLTSIGLGLVLAPRAVLAYGGEPRRYVDYQGEFRTWNLVASAGQWLLLAGVIAFAAVGLRGLWMLVRAGAH